MFFCAHKHQRSNSGIAVDYKVLDAENLGSSRSIDLDEKTMLSRMNISTKTHKSSRMVWVSLIPGDDFGEGLVL